MSNGKIVINVPYIEKHGSFSRLCAKVSRPDREIVLYYEVEKKYESSLCFERGDAFFVALLRYAMLHDLDIESKSPLTDVLYFNITTFLIPAVSQNISEFHPIKVSAELAPHVETQATAVATGFSGGVDSFYTVLKYHNHSIEYPRLTHLLFANVGALTYNYDASQHIYQEKLARFAPVAEELGLEFIGVNTNLTLFYDNIPENRLIMPPEACRTCSCVFALQKLIHVYFFSATEVFKQFAFDKYDAGFYDLLTLQTLSNGRITFYSSGSEKESRMEKLSDICNNQIVKHHLTVCAGKNCGRCTKCLRTQAELYALGVLNDYRDVFDVDDYLKHLSLRFAAIFSMSSESHKGFTGETVRKARENNISIPFIAKLIGYLIWRPLRNLHKQLRDKSWYKTLYYKLNIDVRTRGESAKIWRI